MVISVTSKSKMFIRLLSYLQLRNRKKTKRFCLLDESIALVQAENIQKGNF